MPDAVIMKHIIHDWDDKGNPIILTNCRKALAGKPNAKLLLVEAVISPGDTPQLGKFIGLEMFALVRTRAYGGRIPQIV